MIYSVTKCANEIEEFRYRFEDGDVVLYEQANTSFTYLDKETELFKVVTVDMQGCIGDYIRIAGETDSLISTYYVFHALICPCNAFPRYGVYRETSSLQREYKLFVQSGFPESSQCHYLEAYFEQLALRLGRVMEIILKLLMKIGLVNFFWDQQLKENDAYEKRFDIPYLSLNKE